MIRLLIAFAVLLIGVSSFANTEIVDGQLADSALWPEVIKIASPVGGGSFSICTATIVGPRAVLTAAHCAKPGVKAEFKVNGKAYKVALTTSPNYKSSGNALDPSTDHDIAIGLTDAEVTGIEYASIGGNSTIGTGLKILGYGAYTSTGANDGKLRKGTTIVKGYKGGHLVLGPDSKESNSYFGDSGGPAFDVSSGKRLVIGVHSRGLINIKEDYDQRTDNDASQKFLHDWAVANKVDVCGITNACASPDKDP